jgi:hypothetical protein
MARPYWAAFGGGSLTAKSGLAPTFVTFINASGSNITPPAISEPGSKGLYLFSYDATQSIAFVLDGATTGLAGADRFVIGTLEAQDNFGITLSAMSATLLGMGSTVFAIGVSGLAIGATLSAVGTTLGAIGTTLTSLAVGIGSTASSIGSTSVDPVDLFGFLKRAQEFREGNQVYTKSTGILDFYSRGSSTLLREKTVTDNTTQTTKT